MSSDQAVPGLRLGQPPQVEAVIRSPLGEVRVWLDATPETDASPAHAVRTSVRMDYVDDPAVSLAEIGVVTARLNEVLGGLNGGRPASETTDRATVALWVAERAVLEATSRTPVSALYADYSLWCDRRGQRPVNVMAFGREMGARGFPVAGKDASGRKYRGGLRLKPIEAAPPLSVVGGAG